MPTPPLHSEGTSVAEKILADIKIPSLPEAAVKLLTMCRDEMVAAGEIVRIVELDTALSARLLKVANSAAFGQKHRVGTLTRAAVVMGNENLKVAALGFHLSNTLGGIGMGGTYLREFWRDCIVRACLARRLAQATGHQPREEAFLVGMLQNVGTLVMGTYYGPSYVEAISGCRADAVSRQVFEHAHFGTDHAEVGRTLAVRWNFPEALADAISRQCTEPACFKTRDSGERLWQIAHFCATVPFAPDRQTARLGGNLRNLAVSAFELSMEELGDVFNDTVEQFNALHGVFAHMIPRGCDVESIMAEARDLIASFDAEINEGVSEH